MTEKDKPIPEDDPKQSEAFRKAVRELEADGELNPEAGEKTLHAILIKGQKVDRKDQP